jgi:hypothetical protein
MSHAFISYSHQDSAYAHRLADELSRRGIEAWIDDRIDYGRSWPRVIQDNLDTCPVFIVVMSSNAYQSNWVQNEVSYAQGKKKPIFPLLLEGGVWLSLAAMQYFDVRDGEMPSDEFIDDIRKTIESGSAQPGSEISVDRLAESRKLSSAKPEPNKYYFIVAKHSGKCLDVQDGSKNNKANVFQYEIHGGLHQQWLLTQLTDGYYILAARHSGKVLDVQGYSKEDGANVFQYQLHGGDNQKWEIRAAGDGYYFIVSKISGKALDVQKGSMENTANVFQYKLWEGDNQKWRFVPVP